MKRVAVLGSTGSIGRSALDVIANHSDRLQLAGIAGNTRTDILAEQIRQFAPRRVVVWNHKRAQALSKDVPACKVLSGIEGLIELAVSADVDIVVMAMSGHEGLLPLMRAIQADKQIALASKELLVMAGSIIMQLVRERGTRLIPVDSEHAALFQCAQGVQDSFILRMVLTGSGGPLWEIPASCFSTVTLAQVLAHPCWDMGPKISVDSATLMNKGLEIIEAHWLFGIPMERIQLVIHREAAVHGLLELIDGTILAQMSPCDMRIPIQAALSFPERWENGLSRLDLGKLSCLRFCEPNLTKFACLRLALDALRADESACVVLNAANDIAVNAYLNEQISFVDIPHLIEAVLERHKPIARPSLEEICAIDEWARANTAELMQQCSPR